MSTRLSTMPAPSGRWKPIDYFIPEQHRRLDRRDLLFKARAVVVVNIFTFLTLTRLFRELWQYIPELGPLIVMLPIIVLTGFLVPLNLFIFRRNGSFATAANLYGLVATVAIVCTIVVSGGMFLSPGMTWWPILVMYVFIMGGWAVALGWAMVGLIIFLAGLKYEPAWIINVFSPDSWREAYVSSVILCGFHLMAALGFLEFCQRQLLRRVQVERDRALFSAAHDPLTGLANRKAFQQRVAQMAEHQKLAGGIEAVLMIDLDGFKEINDRIGHKAGDQVLVIIGRRLTEQVRRSDFAARLGGDEFAVLLCDLASRDNVHGIAAKIHAAITAPMTLEDGQQVSVGASIGIALDPDDGEDMDTLLHHADQAMYEAKSGGHPFLHYADICDRLPARARGNATS